MKTNIKKLLLVIAMASLVFAMVGSSHIILLAQDEDTAIDTTEESLEEDCAGIDCDTAAEIDEGNITVSCTQDKWACTDWSDCANETQARSCSLAFNCKTANTPRPAESQKCTIAPPPPPPPPPSCTQDTWNCGQWDTCSAEGNQKRTCTLTNDCKEVVSETPEQLQKCTPPIQACTQDTWKCGNWDTCSTEGLQKRTCTMTNDCKEVVSETPAQSQKCTPPPPPPPPPPACTEDTWSCTTWGSCSDNFQYRACKLTDDCKEVFSMIPIEKQSCTPLVITPKCETDKWECADWGTCSADHLQTRSCRLVEDCADISSDAPVGSQLCTLPVICDASADNDRDGISCPEDGNDFNPDVNGNGISDGLERTSAVTSGGGTDANQIQDRTEKQVYNQAISGGSSVTEAIKTVKKTFKKERAVKKITKIHEVYETVYKKKIINNVQDDDSDGISNEVAVAFKVNPEMRIEAPAIPADTSEAELKIYSSNPKLFGKKCTTSIYSGYTLPTNGFTVLAACPANKYFTLFAIDKNGKEFALKTEKSSSNNKMVFNVDRKFLAGRYLLQVRKADRVAFDGTTMQAAVIKDEVQNEDSDPVYVDIVENVDLAQPTVNSIENVAVNGMGDIQISATSDGRVRVTGASDISSMVVGTFQSAVFTSALFADVENGSFEIVSKPLEAGNHEVTLYAVRPEESLQSTPLKLKFRIIPAAQAADLTGSALPTNPREFPLGTVLALVGIAAIFTGIGFYLKKKRKA